MSWSGLNWVMLFGIILGAWVTLLGMSIPDDLREASRVFGRDFWVALCTVSPDLAGFGRVALMWVLMSAAMMLPTAVPAFVAYSDLGRTGSEVNLAGLAAGFLSVWIGFSLIAATLQMALFQADLVSGFGDSRSGLLSALLLGLAGAYQFTPLKAACLTACRAPVSFFIGHWHLSPFAMGQRLGLTCVGCCWALMLLAFVGGMMSLAFMGLATVIMTLEKLPDIGRWVDKPLGYALLAACAYLLATAI
ncbi:MAG: DUF2182 domain-containing protein [Pseudomonadota bacterium]